VHALIGALLLICSRGVDAPGHVHDLRSDRHPPAATPGIAVLRLSEPLWIVEVDRICVYEPET